MRTNTQLHTIYLLIIAALALLFAFLQKNDSHAQNRQVAQSQPTKSFREGVTYTSDQTPLAALQKKRLSLTFLETEIEKESEEVYHFSAEDGLKLAAHFFETEKPEIRKVYLEQLEQLELEKPVQEKIVSQLLGIEKKRLQAQFLLDDIEFQKADYDREIKDLLGNEKYNSYRKSEAEKSHAHYVDDFNKHLKSNGQELLSSNDAGELKKLLAEFGGGVTIDQSFGPYGTPPTVNLSAVEAPTESFISSDRISLLAGEREYLLETISSPSLKKAVEKYYNSLIEEY